MMKTYRLNLVMKLGALLLALGVVSCGGTDTNDRFKLPAGHIPGCQFNANWNLMEIGLSVANVKALMGDPNQITNQKQSVTFGYQNCLKYAVVDDEDDDTTPNKNEFAYHDIIVPGSITFTGGTDGYVSAFTSPVAITERYFYQYAEEEVFWTLTDFLWFCKQTPKPKGCA